MTLLLLLLATTPPPTNDQVAVLTVGHDVEAVARLQYHLETELSRLELELRPSTDVAERVGDAERSAIPPKRDFNSVKAEAEATFREGIDAYYDENFPHALERLGLVARLHADHYEFTNQERTRLRLWRATIYLASEDTEHADQEIFHALRLNPRLVPDTNEFRPSLRDRVDMVRQRGIPAATVELVGIPATAKVSVDGLPTSSPRFRVVRGTHWFIVEAPRHRPLVFRRTIDENTLLRLTLPIALPEDTEQSLAHTLWLDEIDTLSDRRTVAALGESAAVRWIVVAGERREPASQTRVALMEIGGRPYLLGSETVETSADAWKDLAAWVSREIRAASDETTIQRPKAQFDPEALTVRVDAGGAFSYWQRDLKGTGGAYQTAFSGGGARLDASVQYDNLVVRLAGQFITYDNSSLTLIVPAGQYELTGGLHWGAELAAGYQIGGERASVAFLGGVAHQQYDGTDEPAAQSVFPSYSQTSLRVRVDSRFGSQWFAAVGVHIDPLSSFQETPLDATGLDPAVAPTLGWYAGTGWTNGEWTLTLCHDGWTRHVQYSGSSSIPSTSPISDASVTELTLGGSIMLERSF